MSNRTPTSTHAEVSVTDGGTIDLREAADLSRQIKELSARVDQIWHLALGTGNLVEVDRLTAASHALHRASIALEDQHLVGG
jgi:hypothetical protein